MTFRGDLIPGDFVFWNGSWWTVGSVLRDPISFRPCVYLIRESDMVEIVVWADEPDPTSSSTLT